MTETSRLDQIEAILATVAQQQAATQARLDQTQAICDSNARAIEANSAASAAGRAETDEVRADLRNAVQMVIDLGTHFSQQIEADRAERLALSADVRALVQTLRERFGGNGHGQH
jgi:predicted metal-dependent HD superfamily phosphohydrolase